ncbi:MAG: TonB C-terminal domain-containing protein, partial [Chrysiogenetes bacterium]|nr:TonB C-terminal domain-containing protein [Chrysiogenetes bacterium]
SARSVEEIEQQLTSAARAQSALETADKIALRREVEYRTHVIKQVQRRWSVPANLSRRRELVAVIRFRIDADGTVLSATLEESSGEHAYDDAVLRAAKDVKKLDTPPQEFPRNFLVKFNNIEGS